MWVLGTHPQPGKYHPGLSPRHWVRDVSSSPHISPCGFIPPEPDPSVGGILQRGMEAGDGGDPHGVPRHPG